MTVTISPRGTLFSFAEAPIATEIRKYAGVEGDAVGAWVINGPPSARAPISTISCSGVSGQCEQCDARIHKSARAYLCPVTHQLLCVGGEGCGEKARESAKGE